MRRARDESAEVRAWLESPEGQRWSRNSHNGPKRGGQWKTGAFGELKTDYESCVFTGRCPDHGGDASR